LKALCTEGLEAGGVTYRIIVVDSKGDLKWVSSKIGCLTRGFEHAGRVQAAHSCHLSLGGNDEYHVEDISTSPCWEPTVHMQHPWDD